MSAGLHPDRATIESRASDGSSSYANPRRKPAHESVSLVRPRPSSRARSHSPGLGPADLPAEPQKRPSSSPSSLKPLIGKDDSGESSNADRWFEKSNNHASRYSASFADNSPPFFLQHSSSDETPLNAQNRYFQVPASNSLPFHTSLLHLGTDNSSTEDFRSVIDDLTIENKKLKRKLKGYQKLQDSRLKDQRLFEVRIHGLPMAKKLELEEMLKKFAMGLETGPDADGRTSSLPAGLAHNQSTDSAYASGSGSGQGSSAQPGSDSTKRKTPSSSARSQQQNMTIQSFLHDIPEGLLPANSANMTEKARKKLVVQRLEHIYAGKGAIVGNQLAGQQQEISQYAATMDRTTYYHDRGHQAPREGIREAQIMRQTNTKHAASQGGMDSLSTNAEQVNDSAGPAAAVLRKLDQRPTRPLDLDPCRAQVPADNMQYMQLLGFSPPGADAMAPPEDGHGWIYVNFLANMAQLHTINVTPDFIRKAVSEYSKKLELSSDGRKIRWKGGKSPTKSSSDGDHTPSVGASGSVGLFSSRGSPGKRPKLSHQTSSGSGSKPSASNLDRLNNKLAYTPMFHHRSSNDGSESTSSREDDEFTSESLPVAQPGESSGMTSSGIKPFSNKRKRVRENGPIIFYNNARFCTDLSGDVKTEEAMLYNSYLYHNLVPHAIGAADFDTSSQDQDESKGLLAATLEYPEAMDLDDNPIPKQDELDFPDQSPLSSQPSAHPAAVNFEVSGLGGVCPADNFTINVRSMHSRVDDQAAPMYVDQVIPSRYPANIAGILKEDEQRLNRNSRAAFHKKILGTRQEDLPPSELPQASCFIPDGIGPEDGETSDTEDAISVVAESLSAGAPAAAPQLIDMDCMSSDEYHDGDDEDAESDDSDGSVDLLAIAREFDPEAIRKSEREYDANMAERLAEEIPTGSSAATAGGGSGWVSPASGVDREEWETGRRVRREAREREKREATKRRRSESDDDKE